MIKLAIDLCNHIIISLVFHPTNSTQIQRGHKFGERKTLNKKNMKETILFILIQSCIFFGIPTFMDLYGIKTSSLLHRNCQSVENV